MNRFNNKRLVKVFFILFVLFLLYLLTLSVSRKNKQLVELNLLPSDAKVIINNKRVRGNDQYLKSGHYTISAERKGFSNTTKEIDVDTSTKKQILFISLTPETDEGLDWIEKHKTETEKFEENAQLNYSKQNDKIIEKYPLLEVLPFRESSLYSIEYKYLNNDVVIEIHANSALARQVAIEKITSLGYEPSNYNIVFSDFINPFIPENENE